MEVDKQKIQKRFAEIKEQIAHIKSLAALSDKEFFADENNIAALKYYLIVALEAAGSICVHVCAKKLNCAVTEYATCFETLGKKDAISKSLAKELIKMARFRNLLVHQYWQIDDKKVLQYARKDLAVLGKFLSAVSKLLQKE